MLHSLHKPSITIASGRSQSLSGTQCPLYFGCCLLFLLDCSQSPLCTCCSLSIPCTLQLCFCSPLPDVCSQHIYIHIFVALFIALSRGAQFSAPPGKVVVCHLLLTVHCHGTAIPLLHVRAIPPLRFSYTFLKDLNTELSDAINHVDDPCGHMNHIIEHSHRLLSRTLA